MSAMKTTCPLTLALVASLFALTGCAPAQPTATATTPTPSATSSAPKWTSGDLAACKGYARVEADASQRLADMSKGFPLIAWPIALEKMADDLASATGTASDSAMKQSLVATGAGLRQGAATARANTSGTLDLRPDLQVVADESYKVAEICGQVDTSGTYRFIGNAA